MNLRKGETEGKNVKERIRSQERGRDIKIHGRERRGASKEKER